MKLKEIREARGMTLKAMRSNRTGRTKKNLEKSRFFLFAYTSNHVNLR